MTGAAPAGPPRPPAWVGDLTAALLIVGAVFVPFPDEFRATTTLTIAAAVAPAVLMPLRRRWPIPVLAACVVFYGIAALNGTLAPGIGVALVVAMFAVSNQSTRRVSLVTSGIAFAAILLLSIPAVIGSVLDPRAIQFAVAIIAAGAVGDATRSRREYIIAITERAERAEQTREAEALRRVSEERLRIARDLHDTVAHQIAVISLNAGAAATSLDTNPAKARESLAAIRSASRTVLGEIGALLSLLRGDEGDIAPTAPPPGLAAVGELVRQFKTAGLTVLVRGAETTGEVPEAAGQVAYRVIQEGLTNALKHGIERRAHVLLERTPEQLRVVITNPAVPREGGDAPGGHGLVGLRERVASVHGTVETGFVPGGFRVAATLPIASDPS